MKTNRGKRESWLGAGALVVASLGGGLGCGAADFESESVGETREAAVMAITKWDDLVAMGTSGSYRLDVNLNASGKITIGERVTIGHHVVIITDNHRMSDPMRRGGERISAPVTIEDGVWVGACVTILPGVTLGAIVLIVLPNLLREFSEYQFLFYGVLLIVMMLKRPEGFIPSRRRAQELHAEELSQDAWLEIYGEKGQPEQVPAEGTV